MVRVLVEKVSEVILTLTHMHTILTNFYEAIDLLIDKTFKKQNVSLWHTKS